MIMKPGDIILYPVNGMSGWTSKFVAIAQLFVSVGKMNTQYSHAAVLSEKNGFQYEAKWPRTGLYKIDKTRSYEVWRIGSPTDGQVDDILTWCRARTGEWYNMIGLLTGGFLGFAHTEVCSQFVGYAYYSARPPIKFSKEGQRLLSPNSIPDHPHARLVAKYEPRKGLTYMESVI